MSQTPYQNNFEPKPHYAVTTGTSTAYVVDIPGLPLQTGTSVSIKAHVASGINATINVNGAGAKAIKKDDGTGTLAGDLKLNGVYTLVYDGTDFFFRLAGAVVPVHGVGKMFAGTGNFNRGYGRLSPLIESVQDTKLIYSGGNIIMYRRTIDNSSSPVIRTYSSTYFLVNGNNSGVSESIGNLIPGGATNSVSVGGYTFSVGCQQLPMNVRYPGGYYAGSTSITFILTIS